MGLLITMQMLQLPCKKGFYELMGFTILNQSLNDVFQSKLVRCIHEEISCKRVVITRARLIARFENEASGFRVIPPSSN
jgi:hypothetical protein